MSGICGALLLDGRPTDEAGLSGVLSALNRRGPDRSALTSEGPAALGHALNATTPESLSEAMPLRHSETGCLITADVRLDNRADLLGRLGLQAPGRVIGDGEIILCAYLRWGTDCVRHLAGDFAFAIWDPRHNRLFAARDKVGMRQFIYHHRAGKLFAFATDAEPLLHHPEVKTRINEGRIADLIEGFEAIDETSTFFVDVLRLPPSHALIVDGEHLRTWRYWQLEPPGLIERANDAAYEEAFLEVFTEAVRVRLRAPDGVLGSMLSGGMDSGSVVAVASRLLQQSGAPPLQTVSAIDTDPDCLESKAIRASLTMAHLDPELVSPDMPDSHREALIEAVRNCPEPFDGHMAMVCAIYLQAKRRGLKIMLDGLAGDTTLGSGDVVNWHIENGRLLAAWREARGDEAYWGSWFPAHRQFFTRFRRTYAPAALRELWRTIKPLRESANGDEPQLLDPVFAERVGFAGKLQDYRTRTAFGRSCSAATRARKMLNPTMIAGRERYDRVAGSFAIEQRDPFFDPKLFEFCLTLPVDQLKSGGWPKYVLRRSMAGYLPDEVRWRTGRTHVGPEYILLSNEPKTPEQQRMFEDRLKPYVRADKLANWVASDDEDSALAQVSELRYFAYWLARTERLLA